MGMYVIGFKPADDKWKKMRAVYDSCKSAGLAVPDEVEEFFEWGKPDELGVKVEEGLYDAGAVRKYIADMQEGFEVDLTKLPADIKVLRFFNTY